MISAHRLPDGKGPLMCSQSRLAEGVIGGGRS